MLVGALLLLTKDKDARVRLGAIQAALDRGWGRPAQAVDIGVAVQITSIERTIVDPKLIDHEGGSRETERRLRNCTRVSAQIVIFEIVIFQEFLKPPSGPAAVTAAVP